MYVCIKTKDKESVRCMMGKGTRAQRKMAVFTEDFRTYYFCPRQRFYSDHYFKIRQTDRA